MHTTSHPRSVLLLVLTALIWSLGGLLIKSIAWPPLAIAAGRGIIAAGFLALTHRGLSFRPSKNLYLGAIAYAACTLSFVTATKLTTAANAILLQYTAPVWVALLSAWFLGERATRFDWLIIAWVLGGMSLFFADGLAGGTLVGNAIAVFSGVAFALMTIALRRQKDGRPVESIILGNVLAFACGLPALLAAPTLPTTGWIALGTLGVVQLGLSYLLYAKAIKGVTALEAVLIPVIEPLLNPVWVFLVQGERPSATALLGGVLVLSAISFRAWFSLKHLRAVKA